MLTGEQQAGRKPLVFGELLDIRSHIRHGILHQANALLELTDFSKGVVPLFLNAQITRE
jgi:hypothetical protein